MQVSEEAVIELKKALDEFEKPGAGIHIFSSQGCCGPSIQMDIAPQPGNNEIVVNLEGIDFFMPKDLSTQLETVTIDYASNGFRLQGLQKSGGSCCG